jgi:hypothetical protein
LGTFCKSLRRQIVVNTAPELWLVSDEIFLQKILKNITPSDCG